MTNSPTSNLSSASLQESVDLGEIMFSLCYLPTAGRLTLTVIKCRNLKAMDITGYSGTSPTQGACPRPPGSLNVRIWREKGKELSVFTEKQPLWRDTPWVHIPVLPLPCTAMFWFPNLKK